MKTCPYKRICKLTPFKQYEDKWCYKDYESCPEYREQTKGRLEHMTQEQLNNLRSRGVL